MKRTSYVLTFLLTLVVSMQSLGSTVLWYDFEDLVDRAGMTMHDEPAPAIGTVDKSGNGYDMWAWANADTNNGPRVSEVGDTATLDGVCAIFSGGQDGYVPSTSEFNNWSPETWTMEFSFRYDVVESYKTLIGRDGSAGIETEANLSALYIQTDGGNGNAIRLQYVSESMERFILVTSFVPEAEAWYHMVVRSDGQNLDIFVDKLDSSGFVNVGSWDLDAEGNGDVDHSIKVTSTWTFGRGWYGSNGDLITGAMDDIRFSDTALYEAEFLQNTNRVVGAPVPANTKPLVERDTDLSWSLFTDKVITGYDVYFASDPNIYDSDPNSFEDFTPYYTTNTTVTLSELGVSSPLDYNDTIGWRVDAYVDGEVDPVEGPLWTFTTVPQVVTIVSAPADVVASPDASFSVTATEATGYAWYKDSDPVTVLSTTDTLVIANATLADEGQYYCVVSNAISTETTPAVYLWTKRMVGHWKFEDGLADSVAETVAGAALHNGDLGVNNSENADITVGDGLFTYTAGIDGQAIAFNNDSDFVAITEPGFFNFYPQGFSTSIWYKLEGNSAGWRLPMSKLDASVDGWLFGLDHASRNEVVYVVETGGDWMYGNSNIETGDSEWHMFTATYDPASTTIKLYTDGDYNSSKTIDLLTYGVPEAPVSIGGRYNENSLRGAIDDVRMYSYPLTDVEVAQMYIDMVPDAYICMEEDPALTRDYNNDCRVNVEDLAMFVSEWLECQRIPEDACNE